MYIVDYILSRRQVLKSCPWHYRKYLEKKNIHFKRRSNQIIIFINMLCIYNMYIYEICKFFSDFQNYLLEFSVEKCNTYKVTIGKVSLFANATVHGYRI